VPAVVVEGGMVVVGTAALSHGAVMMAHNASNPPTQAHHPWPKYLGGPNKQPLLDLPTKLHEKYHQGLEKIFQRWEGTQDWGKLAPREQQAILDTLRAYSKDFDAVNSTNTAGALEDALKAAGVIP
jgi:hypothetical protein